MTTSIEYQINPFVLILVCGEVMYTMGKLYSKNNEPHDGLLKRMGKGIKRKNGTKQGIVVSLED